MQTHEKIKALLAEKGDMTCSEVASALGVSRQCVSQSAKKHRIKLTPAYDWPKKRVFVSAPQSRVRVGGKSVPLTHTACGSISELLVAADLIARGYKPYMPVIRQRSHDVIAVDPSGHLVSFEVRSGKRVAGALTWPRKEGHPSMHYAVVVAGEPVHYIPALPDA